MGRGGARWPGASPWGPQDACKLKGEETRVTLEPWRFASFDTSARYFPLPEDVSSRGIGQPVITPDRIHILVQAPSRRGEATRPPTRETA